MGGGGGEGARKIFNHCSVEERVEYLSTIKP